MREESGLKTINSSASTGAPAVDVQINTDGIAMLRLDIPLPFGDCMSFKFPLLPVAREQVEIFESLLRDSQEEIDLLKANVAALQEDNAAIKSEVAALRRDNAALKEDNDAIKQDNEHMSADIAKLANDFAVYKSARR